MSDSSLELLQICDLAKQWPTLQAIHDLAMSDLLKLNLDAQKELDKQKAPDEAAQKAKPAAPPASGPYTGGTP